MSMQDVDIPEVQTMHQTARFYEEDGKQLVEIGFVGSKDTIVRKVQPEHMARYRDEWNAFCDGIPLKVRSGTPLSEVPNLHSRLAESFVSQNVHNAEELAALNDSQCQALGHGTLTARKEARDMLELRKAKASEEAQKRISDSIRSVAAMPDEMDGKYASKADVDEIKALLAQLLQAPKRGRPRKTEE